MRALRPALVLLALVVAEVAAVAGLHRLGALPWLAFPSPDALAAWSAAASPQDALATLLRLVALGCAWWLLASTLLYVGARLTGLPRAIAAVEWVTLPGVRRVADRAVAVVLATSAVLGGAGPALAQQIAPVPALGGRSEAVPGHLVLAPPGAALPQPALADGPARAGAVTLSAPVVAPPASSAADGPAVAPPDPRLEGAPPTGAVPGVDGVPPTGAGPDPSVPTTASEAVTRQHRVRDGEHLWAIAVAALAEARGVTPAELSERAVHAYWVELIEANRRRLASGDPDLVHVGEVLVLPPVRS